MNEKKKQIDALLGAYDEHLRALASKFRLTFNPTCGPTLGRALRKKSDGIDRGVFLELADDRWYEADATNPNVHIAYCAWLRPTGNDYPLYFFIERLFVGKWLALPPDADVLFTRAAERVVNLSKEDIVSKGTYFERLPTE
jgi:hypothetical protein